MRTFVLALSCSALLACGSKPAPPPTAPTPTDTKVVAAIPTDAGAATSAAPGIETLAADEAKSGKCNPEHQKALEQLLTRIQAGMTAKTGDDGKALGMTEVFNRVVALNDTARSIEVSVKGRGTEVHVLAYSSRDLSLDVLAGKEAATTLRSPFQRSSATDLTLEVPKYAPVKDLGSDSRQVAVKQGQPLTIRVTGQGCALVVAFLKPSA